MFAIIETGGKQYRVAKGDVIFVERLSGEAGGEITFDRVLMLGDGEARSIGRPLVAGATVVARVLEQALGDKVIVFKKKRRKNYRRKRGHRQALTVLRITDILPDGKRSVAGPRAEGADVRPAEAAAAPEAPTEEAPKAKRRAAPKARGAKQPEGPAPKARASRRGGPKTPKEG